MLLNRFQKLKSVTCRGAHPKKGRIFFLISRSCPSLIPNCGSRQRHIFTLFFSKSLFYFLSVTTCPPEQRGFPAGISGLANRNLPIVFGKIKHILEKFSNLPANGRSVERKDSSEDKLLRRKIEIVSNLLNCGHV